MTVMQTYLEKRQTAQKMARYCCFMHIAPTAGLSYHLISIERSNYGLELLAC